MKKIIFIICCIFIILSCKQNVVEEVDLTNEEIAQKYIESRIVFDNVENGRNVLDLETVPNFLFNLNLVDDDENPILLNDLPPEQQNLFYEGWKKVMSDYVTEQIEEDDDVKDALILEAEIYDKMLSSQRNSLDEPVDAQKFYEKYFKIREKEISKNLKRNGELARSSSDGTITNSPLVASSAKILQKEYKKGRVFINSTGTFSSLYIGHAAIMSEDAWNKDWEKDGLSQATFSAWPDKNVSWPDKKNGAQKEPIGYWAGNCSGSATKVGIYEMRRVDWKWSALTLLTGIPITVKKEPTKVEIDAAVNYAKTKSDLNENYGKYPYNMGNSIVTTLAGIPAGSKWWDSTCYCSQLVWRSWCEANMSYDFSGAAPVIAPIDFTVTTYTKKITDYSNK